MNPTDWLKNKHNEFCKDECEKDAPKLGCKMVCKMQGVAKALKGLPTVGHGVSSAFEILRDLEQAYNENLAPTKNEDGKDIKSEFDHNAVIVINNINVSVPLFSNT